MKQADRHLIIAYRRLDVPDAGWRSVPDAAMTIRQAKDAYDRGEVELCQGRDGHFATLYAIPRLERVRRLSLFGGRAA